MFVNILTEAFGFVDMKRMIFGQEILEALKL